MTIAAGVDAFVARCRRSRVAQGLPAKVSSGPAFDLVVQLMVQADRDAAEKDRTAMDRDTAGGGDRGAA